MTTNQTATPAMQTYGDYIDGCYKAGNFMMWEKPDADELAMLVLPVTYYPNIATTLEESNWETIRARLEAVDTGEDFAVASFGSWATPYDLMLVRAGSAAHTAALEITAALADSAVLDEHDLSEREQEQAATSLTEALGGLTIVVDGSDAANDDLRSAVWEILTESETPDYIDRSDVERVLRDDLGFTYDAAEYTWTGSLQKEE